MKQAEVEVKVELRSDFPHLSLSLRLPLTLGEAFQQPARRLDRLSSTMA